MPIIPFRALIRDVSPGWLQSGTGEWLLYTFGLAEDMTVDRLVQGTNAHLPTRAQPDAQAIIGSDRLIMRGITESDASYGVRLSRAFDSWHFGGTSRAVLSQILGYLLSKTPMVRAVWTQYSRTVWPPERFVSTWDTYPEGRDPTIEPVRYRGVPSADGDLDWDSASPITGSWGSWSCYLVLYSVGAEAWIGPAIDWGAGQTYSGSGYYSTITGGAYAASGSYTGTATLDWGDGQAYTASADGYYSTITGGAYAQSGRYSGSGRAWGVDTTTDVGRSIQQIASLFKLSNAWIRTVIVSFDASLFDPNEPVGGGINPDGEFGQWSIVSGGVCTPSRFANAVYSGEVK